jgi:predicted dehydrogenase
MAEPLTFGMVGGGGGALIGDVHHKAAVLDRRARLVSGCFSRSKENTLSTGKSLGLDSDRLYASFSEMAREEGKRRDKIDFVSIVAPNYAHFECAKAFMQQGVPVVCDKPLCITVGEARELVALAKERKLLNCVTHAFSGYPMVKHAREMVRRGDIGRIHTVMAEYIQEWLARSIEQAGATERVQGHKQAAWRTDPKYSGISNCVADIGSHIDHTVSYMTGLKIDSLCANLDTVVQGRLLDDNAQVLIKYDGGARGIYYCTQVAIGHTNGLRVRVFGEKGSVEWEQEHPDYLKVALYKQPVHTLSRGRDTLYPLAARACRLPEGLPEGYYECFANTYANFMSVLEAQKSGTPYQYEPDYPTFEEGLEGMKFIELCVRSSEMHASWMRFE